MSEPSCRNATIDDDLDPSGSLVGRADEILTDGKTYDYSLVNVVNSFGASTVLFLRTPMSPLGPLRGIFPN
jgi:hypothetical protein